MNDPVCSICGSHNTRQVFQIQKDGRQWHILGCNHCLTQFVYPVPSDEVMTVLYNDFYKGDSLQRIRLLNPNYGVLSFPRQWGIIKWLVKKRQGKILDFGCGGGHFLNRVSDDWQKYGVEISESARLVAGQKGIVTFKTLDDLKDYDSYFDIVVMFATIEHLPNPKEVVSQLSRLLASGGLFVVMTGDVESVKAKMQGEHWHLYTPPEHLYFFTAHSLDSLMNSLGYKKIKHLYTDGGVTRIPFRPLNLALRAGLEIYHRIPYLKAMPLFDTYYGYYLKL
jgi:SAM-dependent methyltransferase